MFSIDVDMPIAPEAENKWLAMFGEDQAFFSLETVKRIFAEHPDETAFRFNFNCDGGSVDEGFAIYDFLRGSGKEIHCNIESGCHSMAVVLLLAAPSEFRTANKHATSLIHCVRAEFASDMTSDDLRTAADDLENYQEKILDIYANRTGTDKRVLRRLMKDEKVRDSAFLLKFGFISKINAYNTNRRGKTSGGNYTNVSLSKTTSDMAQKTAKEVMNAASNFLKGLKNILGVSVVNYDFEDADGNVIFSTEAEDETLEVGIAAAPDGTFELPDGRTVVIAEGVIAEIKEPETEAETEGEPEVETEEEEAETEAEDACKKEKDERDEEIANLKEQLANAAEVIKDLQSQIKSNYKPANAKRTVPVTTNVDSRDEMRAKLGIKN